MKQWERDIETMDKMFIKILDKFAPNRDKKTMTPDLKGGIYSIVRFVLEEAFEKTTIKKEPIENDFAEGWNLASYAQKKMITEYMNEFIEKHSTEAHDRRDNDSN